MLTCAASTVVAQGDEPIYRVLQFHGLGSQEIEPRTEGVEDGLPIAGLDQISDADILTGQALRKAIRYYYENLPVYRKSTAVHSGTVSAVRSEIDRIHEISILARTGNLVNVGISYRWVISGFAEQGRDDRAEVLVELIPTFTNEVYDRERYGEPLVPEDSYFPDVAREFADLDLALAYDERDCVHNYHSPQVCVESIPLFFKFAEREGLPISVDTAYMFNAFVRGEYARADRLYARAKGYELPKYEGVGNEVAGLLEYARAKHLPDDAFYTDDCEYNYYFRSPCPGTIEIWREFAERHGLGLSRTSAIMFQAYAKGAYRRGDRLFRAAKGIPEADYTGPGLAVMALGLDPAFNLSRDCLHDPTAPNPCVASIAAFESFAEEHGLPVDRRTAAIFDAYIRHDTLRGDKLFARAKGIPIEAVGDPDYEPAEPSRLIIDIVPGGPSPTP